jgi:hypothetical protein
MIGLSEFKKKLGKTADGMTEEQILKLREQQDKMAEILFDMWFKKIKENVQNVV